MALTVVELNTNALRTRAWNDFIDDWLPFDRAQRVLKNKNLPVWDWDPFAWETHVWSTLFDSAALVDTTRASPLLGLIAVSKDRYADFLSGEYLQTTPRNHGRFRTDRGFGQMLMQWAVDQSVRHGFKGALKLISKPATSEGFYVKLGLVQNGDHRGFKIFEFSPQNVANSQSQARLKVRVFP